MRFLAISRILSINVMARKPVKDVINNIQQITQQELSITDERRDKTNNNMKNNIQALALRRKQISVQAHK